MFTLSKNITLTSVITGDQIQLPIISVEIDKSRKTLTNTATIILPRNTFVNKMVGNTAVPMRIIEVPDLLVPGSQIQIQIGYNGNLNTEFTGYVSEVGANIPIEIKCQDEMWNLKQNSFTKSWPKGTLVENIIGDIYTGPAVVAQLKIGGLVAVNQSTAQILSALNKYGLQCYFDTDAFDNNILYVDFAFAQHSKGIEVNYIMNGVGGNVISNDLMYKLKKDSKIQVVGVSNLDTGKKITITSGDIGGEKHTLNYYNLTSAELQKIITAEINHLRYEGYKFSFTTFGVPLINPGDIAVIRDPLYPEHDGSFLIESVKTYFGIDGFRRDVHPEVKLA